MTWHKISFSEAQVEEGAPGEFEREFRHLYAAVHSQGDVALFSNEIASAGIEYYLSPDASALAGDLLAKYAAATCEKPENDIVRLALGPRGIDRRLL